MKTDDILLNHYRNEVENTKEIPPNIKIMDQILHKTGSEWNIWENLIGWVITAAYLLQFLIPAHWWSFGKSLISLRFGF